MSDLLKKAFEIAEKMEIVSSQRVMLKEEYSQSLIYYTQGGSFTASKDFIVFVKALVDMDNTNDIVIVDNNDIPVVISDLTDFLKNITDCYFSATNEYYTKYSNLTSQKTIERLVSLDD